MVLRKGFSCALVLGLVIQTTRATDPQIDYIERYGTNKVTIHFNTDANRTYTVQYSTTANPGTWTNVMTVPAEPFINHFVAVAWATNANNFFRLSVTP